MKKMSSSYTFDMPEAIQSEATKLYRKALVTECTGLLVLAIGAHNINKMKLRSSLTTNLKYFKAELSVSLGPTEQSLSPITILPETLATKVQQGLKLK